MEFDSMENMKEGFSNSDEQNLTFHYSREERLKKAPPLVQSYYEGDFKAYKPGIFKALLSTKQNRTVFFVLIVCFAVVLVEGFLNKKNQSSIQGVPLELTAFSFEENVYVSLEFQEPSKSYGKKSSVPVYVEFSFSDESGNLLEKKSLTHVYEGKKSFLRTTFHDYDIFSVRADIVFEDKATSLTAPVEKK